MVTGTLAQPKGGIGTEGKGARNAWQNPSPMVQIHQRDFFLTPRRRAEVCSRVLSFFFASAVQPPFTVGRLSCGLLHFSCLLSSPLLCALH